MRHGESMGNAWKGAYEDDDRNFLSPYGVIQAQLVGRYFTRHDIEFEHLISSNLTRARHTMACILHEIGWQRPWENIAAFNELHTLDYLAQGDEPVKKLRIAFGLFMQRWISGNALIVSHFHVMRELNDLLGVDYANHIDNAQPYVWNPADLSFNRLDLADMRVDVRYTSSLSQVTPDF